MANHPIVHLDIAGKDPAASSKFYAEAFGWKIQHDPNFDYHMFSVEGGPGGGFVKVDGKEYKTGEVIPYIDTDNIDAALKKIESLGGKTLKPKTEIPGIGWFAFFADPGGVRMGLYTAMQPGG